MNRVDDKVALVTGGGSGIGEATAESLAAGGGAIVVTDINEATAQHTVDIICQRGGKAIALGQDVTSEAGWTDAIDATLKAYGRLNVLVNNAGVSGAGMDNVEDGTFDNWRTIMSVNLDAVYLGCRKAVEVMRDNTSGAGSSAGSIVNISSVMGLVGGAGPAYNASKGGVRLLSKSLAVYCGRQGYNIRVNSVHPGYVWTPLVRDIVNYAEDVTSEEELHEMLLAQHPIGRLGVADDIANGVRFLASDDASFITGSELVIDGGYTAV